MSRDLLPPNATTLEKTLADATAPNIVITPLRAMGNATTSPATALPALAWERGINLDLATTEQEQRALVRNALPVHARKGTLWAVRNVFRSLNLGEVTIQQGNNRYLADGSLIADGFGTGGDPDGWVEYKVTLNTLLTIKQADTARQILNDVAPARCVLWGLDFTGASLIANGYAVAEGSYTAGVITP